MDKRTAVRRWEAKSSRFQSVVDAVEEILDECEPFERLEVQALEVANEIVRQVLERRLNARSQAFEAEVRVGRHRYRKHQPATVAYHSLCGPLIVERWTYRRCDIRNGPTVVPLELAEGLMEDSTPALAFSIAQGYARMPTREYQGEMEAAHRHLPSRSTLERIGKRLGGLAKRVLPRIEPAVRQKETVPAAARSISVGLDRTSVPMTEERPHGESPSTRRKCRTKPYVRKPPAPFDVAYRMAYVGTVALHDADGSALQTRRFAATAEEGPDELVERVVAEVQHLRAFAPHVPLVVVQDGAPELWSVLGDALARHGIDPDHRLIDRFHLNERLAEAAELLVPAATERADLLKRWQDDLDDDDRAIDRIGRFLDRELTASMVRTGQVACYGPSPKATYHRILGGERLQRFASHVGYVCSHKHLMRYASVRARGLPIGSGVTEGACKSVVQARIKRSGSHWYQDGLSACLTLRALLLSDRLASSWPHIRRRYTARVVTTAAS